MWQVANVAGVNGLPIIRLHSTVSRASVDIYLFGATLTSWADKNGVENIFVSSQAIFNGVKAIRGGIPVVFPQFGQPLSEMPQHGFARTSHWSFESSKLDQTAASVTFSLLNNATTLALWPHKFELKYTVTLTDEQLNCTLKVNNIGDSPFTTHTLLHTYLKIPSIEAVRVTGFKDRTFVDKVNNSQVGLDTREVASIEGEVDRVMTGSAVNPIPSVIMDCVNSKKRVTLSVLAALTTSDGVHTPSPHDVVFWNPWIEKAKALADLGDLDYLNFLCLEPGTTSNWVTVEPKNILSLSQTLVSSSF